ncbi:PREDICTED: uncharacterized protein LOC109580484 isoform X5 [Amphimedon queenslandica]|uniref:Uncharacterized protein n=1 Tax=Amphimedon queenslandica TaxID=400682 RepID=A0AAN0IWX2_AMPQE|nr:PREDICTED: uncharacterized protein LOC109580484 isoform X5 [Amphimedon queenslandica]|eukprot:XP_019849269.1 PREDICTED: uncharacterized protein LOC109580484 isoform X5 [Amphimedon queenslandica]
MIKEMSPISFLCKLFAFTLFLAAATSANVCSRFLPSPSNNGGLFTGGVQLLIPSWTFSCQGVINNWFAHVTGNTSVTVGSGIEFQVLKPDPVKSNVYNLIYGNTYGKGGESFNGSRIEIDALNTGSQANLPVRPGYIVGVYIDSNAVNKLSLIYKDTAEDIDIYYWENLTGRMCDLSLCDAKVMRGVRPLIGWNFRNITSESTLMTQEGTVQLLRSNSPEYCNETEVSSCFLPSESVEPTMSTTLIPSSSSSYSSFLISSLPFSPSFISTPLSSSPLIAPSSPITIPSSSPTQGEDDGSVLIIQVSLAIGLIITLIMIFVIILCSYCLYRNKASIKLVTPQSIGSTNNIGDVTNDANPCYGMNITSTGNDIVVYDELNSISDSQHMITTTEANPCYGVSNESQFPSSIEPGDDDDYI